jgi:1,4-dihydroxy-2-naphthoate polyprenyltransferase
MLLYPRHTLPTAAAPVIVAYGLAVHARVAAVLPAIAALVAGWFIQVGGVIADNLINLMRHGDDQEHPQFVQALRTGVVSLKELTWGVIGCFSVAAIAGAYLVFVGGLPVIAVGIASVVAALSYSVGPFPLGDHGLGDPLFFAFFGIVSVMATYYVQAASTLGGAWAARVAPGTVTVTALIASLPVAALATNILVIDNIRDFDFDREKNERTLAVLIGKKWSYVEYIVLLALAYAVPLVFWLSSQFSAWVLLPCLSLPYGVLVARWVIRAKTHEALIPMTPQAGQVLLAHSVLFAIGLAI